MLLVIRQTMESMTDTLTSVKFWLIVTSLVLLCYWSGPFGTIDALPGGLRLVYWALIVLLTGLLGVWAHAFVRIQAWHDVRRAVLVGLVFGFLASGIVMILSLVLLNPSQLNPGPWELFYFSFPSATVVFLITVFFDRPQTAEETPQYLMRPALFKRLKSYPTAHSILALRAQDHYVEVITELGSELCLTRLSDAILEAAPTKGVQIHRSHWVAISAISKLETRGSGTFAHLTGGTVLKISQSRIKELRRAMRQGG